MAPADGRLQPVESDVAGALPDEVVLPQAGFFVVAAEMAKLAAPG